MWREQCVGTDITPPVWYKSFYVRCLDMPLVQRLLKQIDIATMNDGFCI